MNYTDTRMLFSVLRVQLTLRSVSFLAVTVISIVALYIVSMPTHAQQARMMGAVKSLEEAGQDYEQYTVKCGTIEERKLVWRQLGDNLWCGKLVGTFCAENRVEAAHLVCSSEYFSAVEELEKTQEPNQIRVAPKSARQIALETEQREIQSELLNIEAKKLDLRNQELELLRREANL